MTSIPAIATKSARRATQKAIIQREAILLEKLCTEGIDFVPRIISRSEDGFSYEWIVGEHFHQLFAIAPEDVRQTYISQLLSYCFRLDRLGVVHGELDDPRTNLLIDAEKKIWILDFERGALQDFSGKNLRHIAQWLYREGYITLGVLKSLKDRSTDDIYTLLVATVRRGSAASYTSLLIWLVACIGLDQVSKYVFYDLQRGVSRPGITPLLNTGIGRSIPVPLRWVIGLTICVIAGLVRRGWKKVSYHRVILRILSGAIGNLIDRISYQGVRDFIDLEYRPVFNFADIYLSIAICLLVRHLFASPTPLKG